LLLNLFVVAILPAIGEELIFRGAFQKLFSQLFKNKHIGIWLAAALFSAIHLQFYGFIPRMLLGAIFGYLLYWSGSLWVPIWAHFVNNAMGVTLSYLSQKGIVSEDIENIGTLEDGAVYIIASLLIVSSLLVWGYKNKRE
jgi:membrane protease YdiL (CAAX protease family)